MMTQLFIHIGSVWGLFVTILNVVALAPIKKNSIYGRPLKERKNYVRGGGPHPKADKAIFRHNTFRVQRRENLPAHSHKEWWHLSLTWHSGEVSRGKVCGCGCWCW